MMAALLEKELLELHLCLQDEPHIGSARAHDIVGNVAQICLQDISERDIDYCVSLLFSKDKGIVTFLRKVVQQDEFQSCKAEFLEALLSFVKKYNTKLLAYSVDIKEVCMSLFLLDRFAKVKNAAIPVLIEVIQLTSSSKMGEELKIEKLIEKFFMELTKATKYAATVKQHMYHLLGVVAEVYPELMINYGDRLVDMYVQTLKSQMTSKTKKPELSLIAGSLQGLTHLLVHFTQAADEGGKFSYDIYKYTCKAISKDVNVTRYDMPRSGLQLFSRHASQFNQYLLDDYKDVYEHLVFWSSHHNREMLHIGMSAMEAFFKQISETLVAHAKEGRKEGGIFKFFIQQFRKIMDNPDSNNKEISLAIRGYGYFAAPCRLFLSGEDVKYMFNEMIKRSEQVYFSQSENIEDRILGLPSFLDALASIINEMDEISDTFLFSLEKLVIILMENFPKVSSKLHFHCFLSLLHICFSLAPKGAVFKGFMSRIVYQGLLRTCSHPIIIESDPLGEEADDAAIETRQQKISYKDYIDLWNILLNSTKIKELSTWDVSLEQRQSFTEAVYDELMASVLHILNRLDLSSNAESQNGDVSTSLDETDSAFEAISDPSQGLHAAKPKDFIIFINLVDFVKDLLPHKHTQLFNKWIFPFGQQLILFSSKLPLVSGFYKLLAVCMKITSINNYFKGMNAGGVIAPSDTDTDTAMEVDEPGIQYLSQQQACFLLFTKFTKEVLVRLKQYKDDLLSSCLAYILSLPQEIVISELPSMVPAIQMALQIGRSYLPLAHAGLDALDSWSKTLPPDVIRPYYKDILRYLDVYLKSAGDAGDSSSSTGQTMLLQSVKPSRRTGKKKIPIKLLKQTNKGVNLSQKAYESQLEQVRQRCVFLLGSLGGAVNNVLVSGTVDDLSKAAVAWDTMQHLKFDMPFMDIKPTIYFDPFLPRVVELATTSSDRQTKVAACELLHSLVLFMLGRSTQIPGGGKQKQASMEELYNKIFPAVIQLACDVEQVCRQLFEPLMFQLIHWFTSTQMFGRDETVILLDTIMNGVVSHTDTALRDFSARCVKEFLHWSIKQTSTKQMEKSPLNVKMLIRKIGNLARHPSAFNRLGSALAFNNIYTVFREEESLVDIFTFDLLVIFVESLAIAHMDDKSLGTQEQTKKALQHLERIMVKKAKLLLLTNKEKIKIRRKPKDWNDATLNTCVRWLLRQCGRPQTECRHSCMQLVCNLAVCIPGVRNPKDFFNVFMKDSGAVYYIQRFEVGLYQTSLGKQGLAKRPTLSDMAESFSLKAALNWFDLVLCTLDCYTWVFGAGLLNPATTLIVSDNKGTCLFHVLGYFFDELSQKDIEAAAAQFADSSTNQGSIFTPRERDDYNRAKCTVIIRVMDFIVVLLKNFCKESLKVVPGSFWSKSLWETVVSCVVEPSAVGFNMADIEVMNNLPSQTLQLLQTVSRNLPDKLLNGLKAALKHSCCNNGTTDLFSKLPLAFDDNSLPLLQLSNLVKGYQQLQQVSLLVPALGEKKKQQQLAANLLDTLLQGVLTEVDGSPAVLTLTPSATGLASDLMKLAFLLDLPSSKLVDALFDKTAVRNAGSHSTSHLGDIFYALFKQSINEHLVASPKTFLACLLGHVTKEGGIVGNIMTGMLEQVGRDRHLRKKYGSSLVNIIVENWSILKPWWSGSSAKAETKTVALGLLTKMLLIDSTAISDGKHGGFSDVFDMYLSFLVDKDTSLAFKSKALDILAFFCSLPASETSQLKSKLDRLVSDSFPVHSTEYTQGSPQYNDYITALNKILSALELSGSLMLLELVISIVCKEDRHVHEEEIQNTLLRFTKRLPMDRQKPSVDVAFSIFTKLSYKSNQRRSALERVAISMLRIVHLPALKEFFLDHIKYIMKTVEEKLDKSSELTMENHLVSKLCCFELVEVLYSRLTKEEVRSKNSTINQKYCSPKADAEGREMTLAVTKAAQAAKSEDIRGETTLSELRRQYHCAAYNSLVAIISCTQTDEKFYNGFFFQAREEKNEMLWENLVDVEKVYTFPVEMENPLARRKKFVAIRNEVREGQTGDEAGGASIRYITSQYLADSSLSVDVSQFDFTTSAQTSVFGGSASVDESLRDVSMMSRRRESRQSGELENELEAPSVSVQGDYVEMEMDELNQHECMASLTALLQHMLRNSVTPKVEKGVTPTTLPSWMKNIYDKLKNPSTHRNVKLFIAKLIVNTDEVFRPYARFWMGPLVQLITRGELGIEGINYFINDIVITLLSWHTTAIPEDTPSDRAMASRLLEVLMLRCHHETRQVLKNNLEVIKTLVEVWKTRIEIPTKILFDNFTEKDQKSKRNTTGIQLTGVVLANQLSPFKPGCGVDKDKFYQYLAMNMQNNNKQVYAASAEVVGIALKYMADTEKGDDNVKWREAYIENVYRMLLGFHEAKPDRFITCVYRMQLHYPNIANRFLGRILFMLPKVHGEFKAHCLEILQNRVDAIDDVFVEMKSKDITGILSQRDEACQHTTLKLVKGMLRQLKAEELLYLLPSVTAFTKSPSANCRSVMYEILMWVYDNYKDEDNEQNNSILRLTKDGLLNALSDDHLQNRLTVQNFWSAETHLPLGTLDRLVAMLEAMYTPSSEGHYLSYATNLLLEMTSKSPDYNRTIFEHPLSECKFQDYRVEYSWRQRHAAMTPLFVETQASQGSDSPPDMSDAIRSTQVRATQDVQQFSATQTQGGPDNRAPYNWLTQSSMDTFNESALTLATESTASSLMFSVGSTESGPGRGRSRPGPSRKGVGPGFGQDRLRRDAGDQVDGKGGEARSEILRLKRRFLKDTQARSTYFAKKEARLKKIRQEVEREQRQRREHQVTMYRKYRIGDLPDIQIQYAYIIAPLQALAQRDSSVARLLFSSIAKAIFLKIEDEKTEREAVETIKQIRESLNNMLATSTLYFPPFIACLLDISYGNTRQLTLDPSSVSTACITSMQQPLGIVLLDETLIQSESESTDRPSKRTKVSAAAHVSKDMSQWLELARLYKSIGDYDVLQGVFSSQLGTQKITAQAMEAEMRGDYSAAAKLYSQGLGETDWEERPHEVELDLWDSSRLGCYAHLTQWEKLEQHVTLAIDDAKPPQLDKVWEDTFFQDVYLPHLIKGKLKLLLDHDENQDDLATFIDSAMKVPERKALLEHQHCEELALLYIWQEEYDRAAHYVNLAIQIFLQDWSSLNQLMLTSRASRLQTLHKLTEMQEFLAFIRNNGKALSSQSANQLVDKWVKRSADPLMDSSCIWDDVITNRCLYLDHISHKLDNLGGSADQSGLFDSHKVSLRLTQAESAHQQDNFPVALKHLKKILQTVRELGDDDLHIEWTHTYAKTNIRKCQVLQLDASESIKMLTGTYSTLAKWPGKSSNATQQLIHNLLNGETIKTLTDTLQNDVLDLGSLSDDLQSKVKDISSCRKSSVEEVLSSLMEEGYKHIKAAVQLTAKHGDNITSDSTSKAHMSLVHYCDSHLRQAEEEDDVISPASAQHFPETVIESLLHAMKQNCTEAKQMFPRLLQLVELHPDTRDLFVKKSSEVPAWMFLSWVSQITALLDKPESQAVQHILLDIAQLYPEALVYPFKLSNDGYQFSDDTVGKKAKQCRDRIEGLLSKNKLIENLIQALEQLEQPNAIFRDWCTDAELLQLFNDPRKNIKQIQRAFQDMFQRLLEVTSDSQADLYGTQGSTQSMGPYRASFAKKFAQGVVQKFGKDGSKLVNYSLKEFQKLARSLSEQMNLAVVTEDNLKPPGLLKEYSTWLASFQGCEFDQEIEIPGQYTGQSKPMPEYHTKIASFSEKVRVMASLRKPKRIIIRGNDEKDYKYLVKGGEDLRQDQRIEQLFDIMNQVFASDPMCRQCKLQLQTYMVIPMTTRVGLIEWVENTMPLKDLLLDVLTENESKYIHSKKGPKAEYVKFLCCKDDEIAGPLPYLNSYKKFSHSDTVKNFRIMEGYIPWDLSRRAYQRRSASSEAFFTLKSNFAISHGQLCICQYILGIGDRHLSNFMIDLTSGKMVGIDFGHAFGSATQFLPAPELMPFRLTRQLRNLMLPLREKGLMQGTMVHTLRALRKNSQILLNTMDVFIKEPSLDWKQNASKQVKTMGVRKEDEEELFTDQEWYPRQKIAYAKRKLHGCNPAHITRDELKLGHSKNFYFSKAESVVLGDKKTDVRAQLRAKDLTVEQQVACLINQATDPNILGRVYSGWEAWF